MHNNSVLINDEGGITSSFVFPVCHTDNPTCCNDEKHSGRWYTPDDNVDMLHLFNVTKSNEGTVTLAIQDSEYVSSNGQYCCTVSNIENMDQTVCFTSGKYNICTQSLHCGLDNFLSSTVSINAANGSIGYDFALNCTVLGLNITTCEWSKDGILLNQTGPTLFFSPLRLCDAGQYSCTVNSTNFYDIDVMLESMDVGNGLIPNFYNFSSLVPSQILVTLNSNMSNPISLPGSDVILTCIVELSPLLVGSNLSLLMVDVWMFKDETTLALTGPTMIGSTFTYTVKLDSFGRNDSGIYACTATVQPQPNSMYLTGIIPETMDTIPLSTGYNSLEHALASRVAVQFFSYVSKTDHLHDCWNYLLLVT